MIFYKNGNWHISTEQVHYRQHGEEIIQFVTAEGHDWWTDFESKWDHTEIIKFIPVEPTAEQQERLDEINQLDISEGLSEIVDNYVADGTFPEAINHPLWGLQLRKENEELKQVIDALLGVEA